VKKEKNKWADRIEHVFIYAIVLCITGLLISQMLLLEAGTRFYLSKVDNMEGEDITSNVASSADGPLTISEETTVLKGYENLLRTSKVIVIYPRGVSKNATVFVMVNGKTIDNFSQGECRLIVYDGDYVEIDARAVKEPVEFLIKVPAKGVVSPQDGLIVEGEHAVFPIGKIKFKNN